MIILRFGNLLLYVRYINESELVVCGCFWLCYYDDIIVFFFLRVLLILKVRKIRKNIL